MKHIPRALSAIALVVLAGLLAGAGVFFYQPQTNGFILTGGTTTTSQVTFTGTGSIALPLAVGGSVTQVTGGTGVTVSDTLSTPVVSIGQAVDTAANVAFASVQATSDITTGNHFISSGSTPSVGDLASVSPVATGTDVAVVVAVTLDAIANPPGSSLFTVTFAQPFSTPPKIFPNNALNTATMSGAGIYVLVPPAEVSTDSFTVYLGSVSSTGGAFNASFLIIGTP